MPKPVEVELQDLIEFLTRQGVLYQGWDLDLITMRQAEENEQKDRSAIGLLERRGYTVTKVDETEKK